MVGRKVFHKVSGSHTPVTLMVATVWEVHWLKFCVDKNRVSF